MKPDPQFSNNSKVALEKKPFDRWSKGELGQMRRRGIWYGELARSNDIPIGKHDLDTAYVLMVCCRWGEASASIDSLGCRVSTVLLEGI